MRTELPDGGCHIRYGSGEECWYDTDWLLHRDDEPAYYGTNGIQMYYHHGKIHRLDGPAIIHPNHRVEYCVDGKVPKTILDIVIIPEEIDFEMFPSAVPISEYYSPNGYRAYHIHDPDELVLAILRYG